MNFLEYLKRNTNYRVLKGNNVTCVEYFHEVDTVKDVYLDSTDIFYVYVQRGEIKLKTQQNICTVKSGCSAIVNNGNYVMLESLSKNNKSFKAYLFILSKHTLKQFRYENIEAEKTISAELNDILIIDKCEFLDQLTASVSLFFSEDYSSVIKQDLIDLKSIELLHYLSINSLCSELNYILYASLEDKDYALKNTIENSYLNNLSLEEYAALCNMSLSNFKRKFRSIYGTSPAKWIKNKRLEHSINLLESENYKINQIAYECGFNNPKTFRRLFKEKYQVLPSVFKKNKTESL